MRGVSIGAIILAGITGLIIADFLVHPKATNTIAQGIIGLEKNTGNQLLGTPAK